MSESDMQQSEENSGCQEFHKVLNELRLKSVLCDVTVVDDHHQKLVAHSVVLAAGSDILKSTLTLRQSHNLLQRQGLTLKITGITAQIWKIILEYLYLRRISVSLAAYMVKDLYVAAKMLGIRHLVNCLQLIIASMQLDIDLNDETPAINITLAPTKSTDNVDQGVQVTSADLPFIEAPQEHTYVLPAQHALSTNQLNSSIDNEEISNCAEEYIKLSENTLDAVPSLDTIETTVSVSSIPNPNAVTDKSVFCRFCKLHFDCKTALINHLNSYCEKIKREKKSKQLNLENDANIPEHENNNGENQDMDENQKPVENVAVPFEKVCEVNKVTSSQITTVAAQGKYTPGQTPVKGEDASCETSAKITVQNDTENVNESQNYITLKTDVEDETGESEDEQFLFAGRSARARFITTREKLECLNLSCKTAFASYTELIEHHRSCIMADTAFNVSDYAVEGENGDITYVDHRVVATEGAIEQPAAELVETKAGKRTYKCCHCNLVGTKERVVTHLAVVHGKRKPFHCKECDARYGYYETFRDHYASHHASAVFACNECDEKFNKREALRRHVLVVHKRHGKSLYQCRGCGKMFKYSSHARRHERYHLPQEQRRTFVCNLCDKAFLSKQDLFRHKQTHTDIKKYKCSKCSYTAMRKFNVILHERKHGIIHGDYVCITCGRYFLSEHRFQQHLKAARHEGTAVQYLNIDPTEEELTNTVKSEESMDVSNYGDGTEVVQVLDASTMLDSSLMEQILAQSNALQGNESTVVAVIETNNDTAQFQIT